MNEDAFQAFWVSYPRKTAKLAALKAWKRLEPDFQLQEKIKKAIETQKKSEQWSKDGGKFIPHASTWLNQERWDDVLPQKTKAYVL